MIRRPCVLVIVLVGIWIKPSDTAPSDGQVFRQPDIGSTRAGGRMFRQRDTSRRFGGPGGNLADIYCAYCMRRGWMQCIQRWCFRGRLGPGGFPFSQGNRRGGSFTGQGGGFEGQGGGFAGQGGFVGQGGGFAGQGGSLGYEGGLYPGRPWGNSYLQNILIRPGQGYFAQQTLNGRRQGRMRRRNRRGRMGSYYRPHYNPYSGDYAFGW